MRPTDVTIGTFESKAEHAIRLTQYEPDSITSAELALIKDRIRFVLMGADPAQLTVAQIRDWINRVLPGIRHTRAIVRAHQELSEGIVTAADLPNDLRSIRRYNQVEKQNKTDDMVLCNLVGNRQVRFCTRTLTVVPMRLSTVS